MRKHLTVITVIVTILACTFLASAASAAPGDQPQALSIQGRGDAATPANATAVQRQTRPKQRDGSLNIGFDVKPYIAIVTLLIAAFKIDYRRNSPSTVRRRYSWSPNKVSSPRKFSSMYF